MTTQTANLFLRSSCAGTVHIAELRVGRRVMYATRAWGYAPNAIEDAKSRAVEMGLTLGAKIRSMS